MVLKSLQVGHQVYGVHTFTPDNCQKIAVQLFLHMQLIEIPPTGTNANKINMQKSCYAVIPGLLFEAIATLDK